MRGVLTRPQHATPGWLNQVLGAGGGGGGGEIVAVRHGSALPQAGASRVHRLDVTYAPGTPPERRPRLLLKLSRIDPDWVGWGGFTGRQLTEKEVYFYREIAPLMPGVPTIRCFDASCDRKTGAGHLLLEDVSATHVQPLRPDPPPEPVCAQAVGVLAALHAHWWERPDLDRLWGGAQAAQASNTADAQHAQDAEVARVSAKVAAFLDYMGEALPAHRRSQLSASAAFLPTLQGRQASGPHTLIHQDAHWRNFLYPKDPKDQTHPTYLFDWQSWSVGACVTDLRYLLARHWGPAGAQDMLVRLLRRYHEGITERGVSGYSWTQLMEDFRLAVARIPCAPAVQWSDYGSPTDERERWAANVERTAIVFDALGCAALLA